MGFGHVIRCLALADQLRIYSPDCCITFFMRNGREGMEMVRTRGYQVFTPLNEVSAKNCLWPQDQICEMGADLVVFDCRDAFPRKAMDYLRGQGIVLAVIDDISDRCQSADLGFFPPVPQVDRIDWGQSSCQRHIGWEWVLLRREIQDLKNVSQENRTLPQVLITMGGSDPYQFTIKALEACSRVRQNIEVLVVLGPGFTNHGSVEALIKKFQIPIQVLSQVSNLPKLIHEANLVVGSFGNTAYEAAALRRFGIYLCGTADHVESAKRYMETGMGVSLGLGSEVSEADLAASIDKYLRAQQEKTSRLFDTSRDILDGLGVVRITEVLFRTLQERNGIRQAMATA